VLGAFGKEFGIPKLPDENAVAYVRRVLNVHAAERFEPPRDKSPHL
jgi:hypothetical protein